MHPAYSVILFTTTSGAGYGVLFWLGLRSALSPATAGGWPDLIALAIGLALATLGLISSAFHLGHPERAWRAFSQWRTSWLSREGVVAVLTYAPAGLLGLAWLVPGLIPAAPLWGLLLAVGAVATVWCTGMIYGCLRTIPAWNMRLVPVIYLLLSAGTGGAVLTIVDAVAGDGTRLLAGLSALALAVGLLAKRAYWARIEAPAPGPDRAAALGIPGATDIRPLDPPHTQPNFIMREMGYSVARRHAGRLRRLCLGLLTVTCVALLLAAVWPAAAAPLALLAVLTAAPGIVVERWLFFAQARHLAMLYY